MKVGIHTCLENGNASQLAEFCGMGLVVEGARYQYIKVSVASLAGCGNKVSALDGSKLGADEECRAFGGSG
jgi:hypothetical protein